MLFFIMKINSDSPDLADSSPLPPKIIVLFCMAVQR